VPSSTCRASTQIAPQLTGEAAAIKISEEFLPFGRALAQAKVDHLLFTVGAQAQGPREPAGAALPRPSCD
jgi:hypothetical protein